MAVPSSPVPLAGKPAAGLTAPFCTPLVSPLAKVLAHAERKLAAVVATPTPAERLPVYRRFLKIEEHRLRLRHRAGGGGRELCRHRVELLDVLTRYLYADAARRARPPGARPSVQLPPVAVVATGGYGRAELNPYSDVDLLFLHDFPSDRVPEEVSGLVKQMLYLLWDVGFKVGHATRSIDDCLQHANRDQVSKTALLEARLVAGPVGLFTEFRARFERHCVRGHEVAYLDWRAADQEARYRKYGHTVFVQEPHVKHALGGLRDYHNLLWSARFHQSVAQASGASSVLAQLIEKRFLNDTERRVIQRATDFLLRVRSDLHYLNGRSQDLLTLQFQGQIADRFAYPQPNLLRRSEAFMKDYYRHARALHLTTDTAFARLRREAQARHAAGGSPLLRLFTRRRPPEPERVDGFVCREDRLYPESNEVFNQDPFRLLRVFAYLQDKNLGLSPELAQRIRRRLYLINRTFQYARVGRETFLGIMERRGQVARVLRAMHEVDLLGRYLPEFGGLTCLVQHEFNHRYTADEHTLICLEKLDALLGPDPAVAARFSGYRQLFAELEDPVVLYLSLLLHDTGKATSARHHSEASAFFAQKVAARLQLSPERRRALILLVDHHLTLSTTAQTRNLEDPATIAEFAGVVKDRPNLDALMLLTLADGQGTSDENWSDWKESLVWQLYRRTRRFLAEGEASSRRGRRQRAALRNELVARMDPSFAEEIDAAFQHLPDRYFEACDADAVTGHLGLFRAFFAQTLHADTFVGALAPAFCWTSRPDRGHTEVTVAGWERDELLVKITGSFAAAGLNILSADSFPRGDQLSLHVLRVCDQRRRPVQDPQEIVLAEGLLCRALAVHRFDFDPLLQKARRRPATWSGGRPRRQEITFPTRIVTRDDPTSQYTLLEIQTADRLGLLHDLLRALHRLGLKVALSRIATEKGAATDSFYLTDANGQRLEDPGALRRLREAVQEVTD